MKKRVGPVGRLFLALFFLLSFSSCGMGGGGTGGSSAPPSSTFSAPPNISPTSFGTISVDHNNNVWVATTFNNSPSNGLMKIPAGATSCAITSSCPLISLGFTPAGIAVDGSGNVWVTNDVTSGSVTKIPSSIASSSNSVTCSSSNCPTFSGFNSPTGIAVDGSGNVWVTNPSQGSVTKILSSTASSSTSVTCSSSNCPTFSGFNSPTGIVVDGSGNVWVTNDVTSGAVTEISSSTASSSTSVICSSSSCPIFSGFSNPVAITTTNTTPWVANRGSTGTYSPGIVEITGISPCVSGSSSGCPEITHFTNPVGLAFDTSGNLWVIDAGSSTTVEITLSALANATCSNATPCYQYSLPAVPVGIATDSLGNIWISLINAQVLEYKP